MTFNRPVPQIPHLGGSHLPGAERIRHVRLERQRDNDGGSDNPRMNQAPRLESPGGVVREREETDSDNPAPHVSQRLADESAEVSEISAPDGISDEFLLAQLLEFDQDDESDDEPTVHDQLFVCNKPPTIDDH